ncbi:Homoserine O-acetyltransferase OS=Ureibacillus acetophenoni OX=614649 GN=metAA PE=3 SV=1 [Ureibacillus acetophenoni]
MPINIPKNLPAGEILRGRKDFRHGRRSSKFTRNTSIKHTSFQLDAEKEKTELQLLRLLGNTPLQTNVTFLNTATYTSKNVSKSHLEMFYKTDCSYPWTL